MRKEREKEVATWEVGGFFLCVCEGSEIEM